MDYKIFHQSVFDTWSIEDNSIQSIITSPPYWGLRKYYIPDVVIGGDVDCSHKWVEDKFKQHSGRGDSQKFNKYSEQEDIPDMELSRHFCIDCLSFRGQYGLEPSYKNYIEHTLLWAKEAFRVLKDDGVFFLNIGDSYQTQSGVNAGKNPEKYANLSMNAITNHIKQQDLPNKCRMLIPERIAIALIDEGWTLRNHIIWYKPNGMPESSKDRFSKKWESIFMFVKNEKYYFDLDAIREPHKIESIKRDKFGYKVSPMQGRYQVDWEKRKGTPDQQFCNPKGKNPGDVWQINTQPSSEKHYACVTPDTEILTIKGWKKYTDIEWYKSSPHHILVATYNLQKQVIEYQPLSYLKEYDFIGELIKVGNSSLDILMTPNHRNIIKKQTGEEVVVLAEELAHMDKIRVHAPVIYPENNGIGKTLAELIGFIIAEGHYKKGEYIEIYQQEGKAQTDRIDYLLSKLEIPYTKHSRNRIDRDRKLVTWFLRKCPLVMWILQNVPPKKLTQFLVSLPLEEIKSLFDGLIAGDGHIRKDDGRVCFAQKDKETQGWFQILAMRLGYHSVASGINVFLTHKQFIGIRNTNGNGKAINKIKYSGKVWCPKTPNGTWIARRNGRIFITGNTWPEKLVERMLLCSTKVNDTILDPFCGSGTTLKVAVKNNRNALGIDLGYSDIQERKLNNIQKNII